MIESGAPAPDFSLSDQDGDTVALRDLKGQYSVLVFYPLDFSPICTDQLSVYQEVLPELEARGVSRRFAGRLPSWTYPALNETEAAAREILGRMGAERRLS